MSSGHYNLNYIIVLIIYFKYLQLTGFDFLKTRLIFWRTARDGSATVTLPLNDRAFEWDAL